MAPPPLPLEIWQAICEQTWLADRRWNYDSFTSYKNLVNVRATSKTLASAAEIHMFRTLPAPEMIHRCRQAGVPWALVCKEITSGHIKNVVQNLNVELYSFVELERKRMRNLAAVERLMKTLPKLKKFMFYATVRPRLELQFASSSLSSLDLSSARAMAKELCEVIRANSGLFDICLGDLWLSSGEWKNVFAALIEAQLKKLGLFGLEYDYGDYISKDTYEPTGEFVDEPSVFEKCYYSSVLRSGCWYDYHALSDLMTKHKVAYEATSPQKDLNGVYMSLCSLAEARADPSKVGKEMAR